jgi:hypothetical protein
MRRGEANQQQHERDIAHGESGNRDLLGAAARHGKRPPEIVITLS